MNMRPDQTGRMWALEGFNFDAVDTGARNLGLGTFADEHFAVGQLSQCQQAEG